MDEFNAFIYNWHLDEDGTINAFALNKFNESVLIVISGFTPYVLMELPSNIEWNDTRKRIIEAHISEFPMDIRPLNLKFVNKKKLYDANVFLNPRYDPNSDNPQHQQKYIYRTYPYVFFSFRNRITLTNFVKKMSYGHIPAFGRSCKFKFHEVLASPILQFTCIRNIQMTGWITGKGKMCLDQYERRSSCKHEFTCHWSNISPCTDDVVNKIVSCPRILMFDCEANSSNISTMPKNRPDDKIFQISFAVTRHSSGMIEKHLLSLGHPDHEKCGEGVIVHEYKTEADLLLGFKDLIHILDPQVIGGYNILGWDFMYLIQRAKLNGVFTEFSKFGYLVGVQAQERDISWSSSAFNSQHFIFLDAPGRLLIDMLPIVRRDFKFSRYDLGSVATEILGQTKDPLTAKGIFKCYRIFSKDSLALVGKYCVVDSNVTLMLFDKLKTWLGMCQMSAIFGVSILDLYTQGQQSKIYAQVYRMCLSKNVVVEQDAFQCEEDESYTGAIVLEPTPGMYRDVVTFDFASLYPSVMMANNICYSTRVTNPEIPDEDCHIFDWEEHQGCIVEGEHVSTMHESVPIETLRTNDSVITYGQNGTMQGVQSAFFNQGMKKCVKLTMFDGTELKCTYDHRILTTSGWKEAQDIIVGVDKVIMGVQPPRVDIQTEIQPYAFTVGNIAYSLSSVEERKKSLAICRILGLILTDGRVTANRTSIYVGCKIDCQSVVDDLQTIANVDISTRKQQHCFYIHVPQAIIKNIHLTDGITIGKRSTHPYSLPNFLEDAPLCILREFLGGLFGGDGHTLSYSHSAKSFGNVSFSKTVVSEHVESLIQYMQKLQTYLSKFSIETTINARPEKSGTIEVHLMVFASDTVKFYESIGFRHCAHKAVRLMAGVSFYRYHQNIERQRRKIVTRVKTRENKTMDQALVEAHEELKACEYIYNSHYSLPSKSAVIDMMRQRYMGTKTSFQKKYGVLLANDYIKFIDAENLFFNGYAVKPDDTESPVISVQVVARTDIGIHQTYDIEVKDTHSFLCNGIVVHNCEHDTTVRTTKVAKIVCAHRRFRFLKYPEGILPGLLRTLLANRKIAKKEGENEEKRALTLEGNEKKAAQMYAMVCDMRQLALKVSANSMYGGMGVRKGKLPFMHGAMCVTAGGREAIMKARSLIMENYPGKVVYGDTDSLMYMFDDMSRFKDENGNTDYDALEDFSCAVSDDVSKHFPPPMKLEFENISSKFFILTKKRYMTHLTNGKFKKRGIMITRRDNAPVCRSIYENLLKHIFAFKSKDEVITFLVDALNDLYGHRHPSKEYSITKSIKDLAEYKVKPPDTDPEKRRKQFALKDLDPAVHTEADYSLRSLPAHVQLSSRMIRRGNFVEAGSRLAFVVTLMAGFKAKMWQKIEDFQYFQYHADVLRLDMNYYCKSLMNPVDQALETMYQLKGFVKEQLELRLLKQTCLDELRKVFSTKIIVSERVSTSE